MRNPNAMEIEEEKRPGPFPFNHEGFSFQNGQIPFRMPSPNFNFQVPIPDKIKKRIFEHNSNPNKANNVLSNGPPKENLPPSFFLQMENKPREPLIPCELCKKQVPFSKFKAHMALHQQNFQMAPPQRLDFRVQRDNRGHSASNQRSSHEEPAHLPHFMNPVFNERAPHLEPFQNERGVGRHMENERGIRLREVNVLERHLEPNFNERGMNPNERLINPNEGTNQHERGNNQNDRNHPQFDRNNLQERGNNNNNPHEMCNHINERGPYFRMHPMIFNEGGLREIRNMEMPQHRNFFQRREENPARRHHERKKKKKFNEKDIDRFFPLVKFEEEKGKAHDEEANQCNICLGSFEKGDSLRYLACLHRFHQDCIDAWLVKNIVCPVCKKDLLKLIKLGEQICHK